jgi:phosphoribosylformylglycinamidine cyclo-ligase
MRYKDAGVDLRAARLAKSRIKKLARTTFNQSVLGDVGAFGGFYALQGLPRDTVLVASVDGVGTKLKIAFELNRHATVAADLVNHCVNDIMVHGATPLFFLDYLATGKIRPGVVEDIVSGLARACRSAECALIGGETAEMPGFYADNEYDLAGAIVGWVRRKSIVDGRRIRPGDWILGLPSLGLHTNGFSLARKVLLEKGRLALDRIPEGFQRPLGDVLLAPHRCYAPVLRPLLTRGWVKGLVHITGGGISENTPRILPSGCNAQIHFGSWPVPPIFKLIARLGSVPPTDMLRTFNMGLGMLMVVSERDLESVSKALQARREKFWPVGRIVRGRRMVAYRKLPGKFI